MRPIASAVIGSITQDVTRTANSSGESALGDLIADAQLADPTVVTGGQTPVIAFMNPGGIRTDLTYANSPYGEPAGDVTYEEAFTRPAVQQLPRLDDDDGRADQDAAEPAVDAA